MKKTSLGYKLADKLAISKNRGLEAVIKAQLITAIIKEIELQDLTHEEIAKRSKLPRTAVTGIISGSLQKVTIDRILRLVEAVGLVPQLKLTKAA
jgi:predicted XRE-type DNA-binding protein